MALFGGLTSCLAVVTLAIVVDGRGRGRVSASQPVRAAAERGAMPQLPRRVQPPLSRRGQEGRGGRGDAHTPRRR